MRKAIIVCLFLAIELANCLGAVHAQSVRPPVSPTCIGATGSDADLIGIRDGVLVVADYLSPAVFGFDTTTCSPIWSTQFVNRQAGLMKLVDDLLLVQLFDWPAPLQMDINNVPGYLVRIDVASGTKMWESSTGTGTSERLDV